VAHILNGVARTRGEEAGGRARSRSSLSFFRFTVVRLQDLRLSRLLRAFIGQQARRLPARPAPDISGGTRLSGLLDSPPLIDATHPETRSERGAPHAQYEKRRERESKRYSKKLDRSCGCCTRDTLLWLLRLLSVLRDAGRMAADDVTLRRWCHTEPSRGVRRKTCHTSLLTRKCDDLRQPVIETLDKKFQIATSNELYQRKVENS